MWRPTTSPKRTKPAPGPAIRTRIVRAVECPHVGWYDAYPPKEYNTICGGHPKYLAVNACPSSWTRIDTKTHATQIRISFGSWSGHPIISETSQKNGCTRTGIPNSENLRS